MDSKLHIAGNRPTAPPLPPRQDSSASYGGAPPAYETLDAHQTAIGGPWSGQDSRSSSTQSLVPSESNQQFDRRRLLLIYIHGFMGNETSFRSFPAHVHHLLTVLLAETHVVHTKLYPRYRSKRNISFARDDFSRWLEPHEDPKTDVVLLGHSMGGLLSAEVVLMPAPPPANRPFKHHILGTINFDVPFLGMHPGVVKSGLASMFLPAEEGHDKWSPEVGANDGASMDGGAMSPISQLSSRTDTFWQPGDQDPNFNPSFNNDVVLPMRKGWQNALHFMHKHSGNIMQATKQLVTSHMEFGGAMANYGELKSRYGRIRILEEENENVRRSLTKGGHTPNRVRFVNYYTASTGRVRKPKPPARGKSPTGSVVQNSLKALKADYNTRGRPAIESTGTASAITRSQSPRISLEEHSDEGVVQKAPDIPSSGEEDWEQAAESLTIMDPQVDDQPSPLLVAQTSSSVALQQEGDIPENEVLSPTSTIGSTMTLPPVPDLPAAPPPVDLSFIQDTATRKLVEKEHARAVKAYEKAVKDREKIIKDRAKLEEKKARQARKDSEKASKDALKAEQKAKADAAKDATKKEKELTQSEKEFQRLAQEQERMEAEARRMRGEPDPPPRQETTPIAAQSVSSDDSGDPPDQWPPSPPPADRKPSISSQISDPPEQIPEDKTKPEKPRKDRKFCSLPPKDSDGERDPLWVRIFMENVDEVGAHCGLFFVDERYERLVGEVAERIEGWVREDMSERAAAEEGGPIEMLD